ncbi:hypothetical protein HMPREF1981_02737 [Bacteroides pyogenes F0041]|uniref:Uncharacterized protein n=1 Tax=Bacteroides pyogenes F0041 TaxID=1321819 RepID=U2DKI9_9BACE|nr:hypothetical protein HMPREF1981_02737 [Bacteroides pyogenes F0041]
MAREANMHFRRHLERGHTGEGFIKGYTSAYGSGGVQRLTPPKVS